MDANFEELMGRVRAGDADAVVALVRQYESAVRVAVRARLFDREMRRQFDSIDICQSVLASFFFRVAAGQFDLQRPSQLVALLTKMAHNKIAQQVRYYHQKRRDIRRKDCGTHVVGQLCATECDPVRHAEAKELLEHAWRAMHAELRKIVALRIEGESWEQIAEKLGGTPGARRKQFARGLDEIAGRLGIDEATNHASRQLA